jgi:uncharacterized membrane protein
VEGLDVEPADVEAPCVTAEEILAAYRLSLTAAQTGQGDFAQVQTDWEQKVTRLVAGMKARSAAGAVVEAPPAGDKTL